MTRKAIKIYNKYKKNKYRFNYFCLKIYAAVVSYKLKRRPESFLCNLVTVIML